MEIPAAPRSIDHDDEKEKFTPAIQSFGAHHLLWLDCLQKVEDGEIKRLMGLMPPGAAKALALDTPIPTPTGWKAIGELKIGDHIFDERGKPCSVTWVSPVWHKRPCYKVITDCGDEIIADQDHEWPVSLWSKPSMKRVNLVKLRTTKELAHKRTLKHVYEVGPRCKRPMIVHAGPLELPKVSLPIDPYILGAWLGDGATATPNISTGQQDVQWWIDEFARLGVGVSKHVRGQNYSLRLLNVREHFRALGLVGGPGGAEWGKKFIPKQYMRASAKQRLALLQGLVDTDAHVASDGAIQFTNTNANLIVGVVELVRSLGAKAFVSKPYVPVLNGNECAQTWKVRFMLAGAARMPRKAQFCCDGVRTPNIYLTIEPYERTDTICIEVDSPSHLYLCGRSMTPTHNSTYTSVVFPTHFLGRFPDTSIIVASYASDLPKKFGRRARAMVQQPMYKRIFDTELSDESAAVDEWALQNGSEWMAKGILTGITGHRVDGIVWDDLIKGREQADSDLIRQKTWDAYLDDLQTRRKPTSWEVGITTRWHEDDIAGRILPLNYEGESGWVKGQDGNNWYVLCLPAECDRLDDPLGRKIGEILWPEWFTKEFFAPFKRQARTWSALYQQKPAPETGTYFDVEWLKPYERQPLRDTLSVYGASDYAVSSEGGDYTVHIVVGLDPHGKIYVLDLWRGQTTSDVWIEALCNLIEKWKPVGWAEETGQIRAGIGPYLDKRLRERQLWVVRASFPARGDKSVRAQSIRGRMAMDGLWVPTAAPWYPDFKKELMAFPAGRRDDQVDALGLIGQVLDKMVSGMAIKVDEKPLKIISTDSATCTVTLDDLWANEEQRPRRWGRPPLRIQ